MTLYLDLDETLIHAMPLRGGRQGRRRIVRTPDGTGFVVMERPMAARMIRDCHSLGRVVILTTADQDYAEAVCAEFQFAADEILGCEKFIAASSTGDDFPLMSGVCPAGCLIDNNPPTHFYARLKMSYLGIPGERYFTIRPFLGRDPGQFEREWELLFEKISRLALG